ncbi:MAG: adenylate/guanylate cyclase domain-containing protein [Pseudomonadota bacterium]
MTTSDRTDQDHSLRSEEIAAQKTAFIGRTIALLAIAPIVTLLSPWPAPIYTFVLLAAFIVLGWGAWRVAQSRHGRLWHQYAFVFADFALLTFTLIYPNPLIPFDYPPQFALRYGAFVYFFVILAGLAYVYQPKLVMWGGVCAALTWTIGVGWLVSLPDSVFMWVQSDGISVETALAAMSQPTYIDLGVRVQELAVFLIAAGLLALAVSRSRKIAIRQVRLARERENLGRYFPEKTAQMLADRADPFATPMEHKAAVLFADLVAFTTWSEQHSPQETIALLREVHGILAEVVFRQNGTLDKFIGDGLMATFGTPEPTSTDASDALAAMVAMLDAFEHWRSKSGPVTSADIRLAVGVHYGPVVIGNIGAKNRLEFAVLGDTVNVASRLEGATRQIGCRGIASGALVAAAKSELHGLDRRPLERLSRHGMITIRGRTEQIEVYTI